MNKAETALHVPEPGVRTKMHIPYEGDNGVFTQSWFPICLSSEVGVGERIGQPFLDGRVVVFRGDNGVAQVLSAVCPHVGADLSVGKVVGNNIECAFHRWQFNQNGKCVQTGLGDPAPPKACLFEFPTLERYGIIWAFNGEEPLFDVPDFDYPDDELLITTVVTDPISCDGWVFACNTPDMQHIEVVHGIKYENVEESHSSVNWNDWGFRYPIKAEHGQGPDIDWEIGITGTSIFQQQGTVDGWWFGAIAGFSCPQPWQHRVFAAMMTHKGDGSPAALRQAERNLLFGQKMIEQTAFEDRDILNTVKYEARNLTRHDRTLSKFLKYLQDYPRAHPSAQFIK